MRGEGGDSLKLQGLLCRRSLDVWRRDTSAGKARCGLRQRRELRHQLVSLAGTTRVS
jgi:hypothetical protein